MTSINALWIEKRKKNMNNNKNSLISKIRKILCKELNGKKEL
jgi:hypothetical protein